jgi:hypothetical protein
MGFVDVLLLCYHLSLPAARQAIPTQAMAKVCT